MNSQRGWILWTTNEDGLPVKLSHSYTSAVGAHSPCIWLFLLSAPEFSHVRLQTTLGMPFTVDFSAITFCHDDTQTDSLFCKTSVLVLQKRLLIICCLLLLLLRSLVRGSCYRIGHRRHAGVVVGWHIHGHACLRWVRSSCGLAHVRSVQTTAVK